MNNNDFVELHAVMQAMTYNAFGKETDMAIQWVQEHRNELDGLNGFEKIEWWKSLPQRLIIEGVIKGEIKEEKPEDALSNI